MCACARASRSSAHQRRSSPACSPVAHSRCTQQAAASTGGGRWASDSSVRTRSGCASHPALAGAPSPRTLAYEVEDSGWRVSQRGVEVGAGSSGGGGRRQQWRRWEQVTVAEVGAGSSGSARVASAILPAYHSALRQVLYGIILP